MVQPAATAKPLLEVSTLCIAVTRERFWWCIDSCSAHRRRRQNPARHLSAMHLRKRRRQGLIETRKWRRSCSGLSTLRPSLHRGAVALQLVVGVQASRIRQRRYDWCFSYSDINKNRDTCTAGVQSSSSAAAGARSWRPSSSSTCLQPAGGQDREAEVRAGQDLNFGRVEILGNFR